MDSLNQQLAQWFPHIKWSQLGQETLNTLHSKFANIVVIRADEKNNPQIKKLMAALRSPATQQFILQKYHGEVLPVP